MQENPLLTEKELSRLTGLSVQTLRNYRSEKKVFPYIKLGHSVRYRREDVETIINQHRIETT
jgi:predicted DNA-binding transcriptional regulator AlpA